MRCRSVLSSSVCFFFQAEDGIRDWSVTGVQTCALPISDLVHAANGVVAVAYPFSGMPTRQQVELDGFPAVYAMCAIDALGIPAMAGRDEIGRASCRERGEV